MGGTRSPKESVVFFQEKLFPYAPVVLFIPATLFLSFQWDPRFSHYLAEMFSILVACGVFTLMWNSQKFIDNKYFIFLGIGYLFVGAIDSIHLFKFGGAIIKERSTQSFALWFSARFVQSVALIIAPIFVSRRIYPWLVFLGFTVLSTVLATLALTGAFPILYIPWERFTPAESLWDFIIVGIQLLSIGAIWRVRNHFDGEVFQRLVASILLTIAAELLDDLNPQKYMFGSLLGHYLNVVSYYLVYKAIIVIGLNRPYDLIFREMKRNEEKIRLARDELEERVTERTEELRNMNVRLERELSDRIRMEEERGVTIHRLRESEDRFRSLVENEPVGTMIVQDGFIIFRNPEMERIVGPIPEAFDFRRLGPPHPEDVPKFERLCSTVREGEPFRQGMELRFSAPAVKTEEKVFCFVQCRTVPIDFQGKPALLVNMVDITRMKDLEQIVLAREKLASLGQLTAGIAHEIRNPLSGININISTLDLLCHRAEGLDPEEKNRLHEVIAQAKTASDKIGAVIKRILDFSKPIPPRMDRVDVVQVVRDVLVLSAASIRKGDVKLLQEISPEPLYCRADATLLQQAILNLVTNALQALETVDREKYIKMGVTQEEQQAVIRVVDNGPGVAEDLLGKIFDPFYTTRKEGHGIGLSFSRRVISKHNGRLSAGPAEGGGAVFRIELPLWRERRSE